MSLPDDDAKARVRRGFAWTGLSSAGTHVLNLARVMLVARLLTPEDFGVFGMAMVVLLGVSSLGQLGFKEALIAHQQDNEGERQKWLYSLWTGNLVLNLLLGAMIAAAAWPTAQFYAQPELFAMLLTLCAVPVITALNNPQLMALEKRIALGPVAAVELAVAVAGLVFTVVLAWTLRSPWALVLGQLIAPAAGVLLSYRIVAGRPRLAWDRDAIRQSLRFGKYIMLASGLNMVITQLDNLAIGAQLGAAALGIYMIAYRISEIPKLMITKTVFRTLYPYYSQRLQDGPTALRDAWLTSSVYILWLVAGAYLPMALCSHFFIETLFGAQWRAAAPILTALALLGALRTGNRALVPVLMALRKTRIDATLKALEAGLFLPAVFIGLAWTQDPIGAAWAGVFALFAGLVCRAIYVQRILQADPGKILRAFVRPLFGTLVTGLAGVVMLNLRWPPLLVVSAMVTLWACLLLAMDASTRRWVRARLAWA